MASFGSTRIRANSFNVFLDFSEPRRDFVSKRKMSALPTFYTLRPVQGLVAFVPGHSDHFKKVGCTVVVSLTLLSNLRKTEEPNIL